MHFHISGLVHASTDVMNIQNCKYQFRDNMILYLTVILVLLVKSTLSTQTEGMLLGCMKKKCFWLAFHLFKVILIYYT